MPKLLLDANLSWRIVKLLDKDFHGIQHITDVGFTEAATDKDIWLYAQQHGYCIVTNDEDFNRLVQTRGFPPKVVLLRTGNQSTAYIAQLLVRLKADITDFAADNKLGVLEVV